MRRKSLDDRLLKLLVQQRKYLLEAIWRTAMEGVQLKRLDLLLSPEKFKLTVDWKTSPFPETKEMIKLKLHFARPVKVGYSRIWSIFRFNKLQVQMDMKQESVGWRETLWGDEANHEGWPTTSRSWDLYAVEDMRKPGSWFQNAETVPEKGWTKSIIALGDHAAGIRELKEKELNPPIWVPPELPR